MEYDNEENFLEFIGPDRDEADQSMEDDEALLDEGDDDDEEGEEVVTGEEEDADGSEYDDGRNEGGAAVEGEGATGGEGVKFCRRRRRPMWEMWPLQRWIRKLGVWLVLRRS
jgi:hypothetical protein